MTSDAKIGLLLGLVFIFIIAFIINGLPNFKSEVDNNELTTTMVSLQNKQLGIGSGVTDSEVLSKPKLLESPRFLERPALVEPATSSAPVTITTNQPLEAPQTIEVSPATSDNQTVRYSTALPGSNNNGNSNSEFLIEVPEPTKTIEITAPVQQEVVVQEVSSVEESSLRQVSSDVVAKVEKPKVASIKSREYVVQEGDSLGSISKKLYGEELGNKKVNIDKIFAANKTFLKSPDSIYVGQKLIIPAIEGSAGALSQESKPLGSSLLERVKRKIGQRDASATKQEPTKQSLVKVSGRKYVVKEGDNLWKIAHNELGDGSRFGEISKMNQNVLKNQDSIVVGMTLVLPKK